jgi:tripartite-type tricarboxylate transporter receptor subunit TctC
MHPNRVGTSIMRFTARLLCTALALSVSPAGSQPFPTRQITLVVPFAAGGSNDVIARVVGARLQKAFGQPVVIENQSGASGSIGVTRVAKAEPDGYTLIVISSTFTIDAVLQAKQSFDAQASFAPVALLGRSPLVLATAPTIPVKSPADFLAYARANKGKLNYGSAGNGSINQIGAEMLKSAAAIDLTHVPYRGVPLALNDLIAGQVHVIVGSMPAMMAQILGGKVTGIAVTSRRRSIALPDLPTLDESIAPGYELYQWWAVLAPAATPATTIGTLNSAIDKALEDDQVKAAFAREGAEVTPGAPADLKSLIAEEISRWRKLAAEGRIHAE